MLAYLKEITPPLEMGFPPLTKQSFSLKRMKMFGLISVAELNMPQATWMLEMAQSVTHVFTISTVYVGIPLGRGSVGDWFIWIVDLPQFSSRCEDTLVAT